MRKPCKVSAVFLVLLGCLCGANAGLSVTSNEREAKKPVQLTGDSFDTEIEAVPSSYSLLVEFYAHWYVLFRMSVV